MSRKRAFCTSRSAARQRSRKDDRRKTKRATRRRGWSIDWPCSVDVDRLIRVGAPCAEDRILGVTSRAPDWVPVPRARDYARPHRDAWSPGQSPSMRRRVECVSPSAHTEGTSCVSSSNYSFSTPSLGLWPILAPQQLAEWKRSIPSISVYRLLCISRQNFNY
jgi:hypothetical protein